MAKTEYNHIRVPKELHEVLKKEAETRDMSIADYIAEEITRLRSIESLASDRYNVNTAKNSVKPNNRGKGSEWGNTHSPGRIRTPVTGSKGQYA
jgi:hypothetical protein